MSGKAEHDPAAPDRPSVQPPLEAGALIAGRFRLVRCLGEGGMGQVWEAVHAVTRKPVALKFLKRKADEDGRAVQRFLREARAVCAVRHPSVIEVHDVLELEDGSPVMVMDLLSGETLAQRLARERTLPLPELGRIMVHVCSAVGCAHSLGIVHRDLKPENIFLARSPTGLDVKVLDFGIAKLTAAEGDAAQTGATTGTGVILGSPYYMAPEQLFGERDVDHRADIWALGVIFYEALSGDRPTQAANMGQVYKVIMTDAVVPLREKAPHLPPPILGLVSRMLSRDRRARPADVREVLRVLSDFTNESFVPVEPPATPVPREPTPAPPHVDSDTARASTVNAASGRSSAKSGAGARWESWRSRAILVVAVASIAGIGLMAVRDRSRPTPSVSTVIAAPTPAEPPISTSAPSAAPQASEVPTLPSTTPTSAPAPEPRRAVAPPARVKPAPPPPPQPSASSKPPPPPVDPASYQ